MAFGADEATGFPTAAQPGGPPGTWISPARWGRPSPREAIALGVDVVLGFLGVNMKRSPRCGRNFEYFSEDPPNLRQDGGCPSSRACRSQGVGTSIKHYVANDHEWNRDTIDVKVSERALRRDLPARLSRSR